MMRSIAVLILVLACCPCGLAAESHKKSGIDSITDEYLVLKWRSKRVSLSEIESGKDFSKASKEWRNFAAKFKQGDEVWYFCSPGPLWEKMLGWEGYAIFRGGHLVDTFTTREN